MLEVEHLKEFLGITQEEYEARVKGMWDRSKAQWTQKASEAAYYKETDFYLYDLTQYQADPGRKRQGERIAKLVKDIGAKVCCDYGSGIGSDAEAMFAGGAELIYLIDYPGATADYCLWRLVKLGFQNKIRFISLNDAGMPIDDIVRVEGKKADLVSSFAALEHCQDPAAALAWIHRNGTHAILRPDPSNEDLHMGHHAEHFAYLQRLLDIRKGEQAYGFEKIDQDDDPPLFKVIEGSQQ